LPAAPEMLLAMAAKPLVLVGDDLDFRIESRAHDQLVTKPSEFPPMNCLVVTFIVVVNLPTRSLSGIATAELNENASPS
jgi:hypothetical protein